MLSLWLVPGPENSDALKTIMSPQHDTSHLVSKSSYPKFLPHVTLATMPSRDLSEIRNAIPQAQRSFPIKFSSVDVGNHYFRSVYISVELTEELAMLHKEFHENIKVPPKTPSFPHCSICYIADEDAANGEREKFAEELRASGKVREDGEGSVSLRCLSSAGEDVWMNSYAAKEIWVVQCEGPVEEWKVLDQIKLE